MRIERSRIINLDLYLVGFAGDRFHVLCDAAAIPSARLEALGLMSPSDGDLFLPAGLGPVSRFNADGKWKVRRDLPKESRYIRTTYWEWETWDGASHSDFRDIFRDCYPRELIEPPSVQLTYRVVGGRKMIVSPLLEKVPEKGKLNKHVINLFLELFGSCELVAEDLTVPPPAHTRHVNWRFLPPGRHPWDRLKDHLDKTLRTSASGTHFVIMDRQKTIMDYGPDELYVGEGGFNDYIGYVFRSRGLVVLESIQRDNAYTHLATGGNAAHK